MGLYLDGASLLLGYAVAYQVMEELGFLAWMERKLARTTSTVLPGSTENVPLLPA